MNLEDTALKWNVRHVVLVAVCSVTNVPCRYVQEGTAKYAEVNTVHDLQTGCRWPQSSCLPTGRLRRSSLLRDSVCIAGLFNHFQLCFVDVSSLNANWLRCSYGSVVNCTIC